MKKITAFLALLSFLSSQAFAVGKFQNEDMKSLAELTGAGGSMSQLTNDTKLYLTANGLNEQLSTALTNGDILNSGSSINVAHGGTGLSSGTSGGIPYFSSTSTMASSTLLQSLGVVLGGGAGGAPTSTAAGTAYQELQVPSGGGAPAFFSRDNNFDRTNYSITTSVGAGALTINLVSKAASTASSSNPIRINFGANASGGAASYSTVEVTGALSVIVPSGATLASRSGLASYVYVYALNNSGVVELVVSAASHWDEGMNQSTTALSGSSNSNNVLYSTTARSNVFIRKLARLTLTESSPGTWATLPANVVYSGAWNGRSEADARDFTGYGSTSTKIPYYTNVGNTGSAITFTNNATLGAVWTINEPGIYCASVSQRTSTGAAGEEYIGLDLNASPTTALTSLSSAAVLCMSGSTPNTGQSDILHCSWCGWLDLSDTVSPHTTNATTPSSTSNAHAHIVKMFSQ